MSYAQYVSAQSHLLSYISGDARESVVNELHSITEALEGLVTKNYGNCACASTDAEAVEKIAAAINNIQLFAPRIADDLCAVHLLAKRMAEDVEFREIISTRVLSAREAAPTRNVEPPAR